MMKLLKKIPLDLEANIIVMTSITGTSQRCYAYADYFRQEVSLLF